MYIHTHIIHTYTHTYIHTFYTALCHSHLGFLQHYLVPEEEMSKYNTAYIRTYVCIYKYIHTYIHTNAHTWAHWPWPTCFCCSLEAGLPAAKKYFLHRNFDLICLALALRNTVSLAGSALKDSISVQHMRSRAAMFWLRNTYVVEGEEGGEEGGQGKERSR